MEVEYDVPQTNTHELDVERTLQELQRRKQELEEAINQVSICQQIFWNFLLSLETDKAVIRPKSCP